jgi:hypothetical protein
MAIRKTRKQKQNKYKYKGGSNVEKRIFVLWLGNEEMNANRKNSIQKLPDGAVLITKDTINDYVIKDHPIHPAYEYLSTIHKSDYLRCYLMHHHGGGYMDVKPNKYDWDAAFKKLNESPQILLMGVIPTSGHLLAGMEEYSPEIRNELEAKREKLVCMGWLICRPYSTITTEWYNTLNKKLDEFLPILKKNPAKHTRESFNRGKKVAFKKPAWELGQENFKITSNYPITWNILLAQILYPIQLRHLDNIDNTTLGKLE